MSALWVDFVQAIANVLSKNSHAFLISRVLIVYPWTERYFGTFGDIFTVTAILQNSKVAAHGKVVLKAVGQAVENMDNIKDTYATLSRLHYEKLHVDPDNFRVCEINSKPYFSNTTTFSLQ